MLKPGIAFLARLVRFALVIEARNGKPGTISTGLSRLGVKMMGKGIFTSKQSTVDLQSILGDTLPPTLIHPQTKKLVADELGHADSFIDSLKLCVRAIELVLVDQHPSCPFLFAMLEYTAIGVVRQERRTMKRTNLYLTEKQVERLHQRAEKEGLALAELVRRAIDAFLAWDDPTYVPQPKPQIRNAHSSPG